MNHVPDLVIIWRPIDVIVNASRKKGPHIRGRQVDAAIMPFLEMQPERRVYPFGSYVARARASGRPIGAIDYNGIRRGFPPAFCVFRHRPASRARRRTVATR